MAKLVFGIAVGLAVALLAGWIWGASGRSDMARALQTSELRVEPLQTALARVDDAQRMTGKLDQSANARAGEAAKSVADVLAAEAKR